MEVAYGPARASAAAVQHLVAPGSRFTAPSTFPQIKDCLQYAEDHGQLMKAVNDLQITSFDVQFAKGSWVCLPYSAEGSHAGAPHPVNDLQITSFDVQFAKGSWVCLPYSAEGSHAGAPHPGIPATHRRAHRTAAAMFELTPKGGARVAGRAQSQQGQIKAFWKDWEKLSMWAQLGRLQGEPPALE